jgi:hypothetical protein
LNQQVPDSFFTDPALAWDQCLAHPFWQNIISKDTVSSWGKKDIRWNWHDRSFNGSKKRKLEE